MKLRSDLINSYELLVEDLCRQFPEDIAMARAVGSADLGDFSNTGDVQVEVLRSHGLIEGMKIFDLGCGSGRTARALERANWTGEYLGSDVVKTLVDYLNKECLRSQAFVNRNLTILANDNTLDLVFHWSVFTHLLPEECYVYLRDIHRALKPGGRLVFSFLEMENTNHYIRIFKERARTFAGGREPPILDTFLHRGWLAVWAADIGFTHPQFTDGFESGQHRPFWQTLARMDKRG